MDVVDGQAVACGLGHRELPKGIESQHGRTRCEGAPPLHTVPDDPLDGAPVPEHGVLRAYEGVDECVLKRRACLGIRRPLA